MDGRRGGRPAPRGFRVALVALGLVAGLGLAEVVVRLAGLAPAVVRVRQGRFQLSPNPKIGYEPVPDLEYHGRLDSFYDYQGKSNRLGFRDRDHPVAKEPGVLRILLLGDSVAAGQGIHRYEDTFPARLERDLDARGLPTEVLNFAVTGYNTQQEVETLKDKGLAYEPDLVLLAYCLNDKKRSDGGVLPALLERARGESSLTRSRLDPVLMHSALYRYVRFLGAEPEIPGISGDTRAPAFALLERLARDNGFAVLVAVFPRFGGLLDYRWGAEHRWVAERSRRHGFAYLDLLPAFQECRRHATGPLGLDRYHPTVRGHRCAAEALADYLVVHHLELTR